MNGIGQPVTRDFFALGVSLIDSGDLRRAIESFEQALAAATSKNDRGKALYNMAACYARMGDNAAAIENLKNAVAVLPLLKATAVHDSDFAGLREDEHFREFIADTTPGQAPSPVPEGISGWLSVVALGLVGSPVVVAYRLWTDDQFASHAHFESGNQVIQGLFGLMTIEILGGLASLAALLYLNFLFFKKKQLFPRYFIIFLAANVLLALIEYWACPDQGALGPDWERASRLQQSLQGELASHCGKAIISAAVWIPYFMSSRRVKNTFIE